VISGRVRTSCSGQVGGVIDDAAQAKGGWLQQKSHQDKSEPHSFVQVPHTRLAGQLVAPKQGTAAGRRVVCSGELTIRSPTQAADCATAPPSSHPNTNSPSTHLLPSQVWSTSHLLGQTNALPAPSWIAPHSILLQLRSGFPISLVGRQALPSAVHSNPLGQLPPVEKERGSSTQGV